MIKNILKRCLKSLFPTKESVNKIPEKKLMLTIKDIKVYDDVFIKDESQTFNAWVMYKNINSIMVGYSNGDELKDYTFNIRGLWNKSIITEGNKILILNKEDL